MNILVTGGAGFIGSHLCETLLKDKNNKIICLDNFNDYYDPEIKKNNIQSLSTNNSFIIYQADILDTEKLAKIFEKEKIDTIIHLAARAGVRPSIEEPMLYQKVNIEGTLNLLEAAKKYKIKKLLFASSSSVYGNNKKVPFSETDNVDYPVSPYAATKKAGELLCYNYHHLYQIPIVCLRFFTVYGPRQRPEMAIHKFTRLITENKEIPVFNNGNCLRDFTYIDDIIQGITNILKSDFTFDIVNLGESATTKTIDLIKLIENALGKKAKLKMLPAQPGDVEKTFADITRAKEKYGYNPEFPIDKGIDRFIKWFEKS
jgi:UDP-glucuronate 4-epimerase